MKKFLYNPIIGSYGLLNKSYNNLKTKGNETLMAFKEYLEDDDIRVLLHVTEVEFEFLQIEIFDLVFVIRMEIELVPEFNSFRKGFYKTYHISHSLQGAEQVEFTGIQYKFDIDGRVFKADNAGIIPDYSEMSAFVLDFVETLIKHVTKKKYVTIPNNTYEE